jgi:hypothetical protein
MKPPKLSPAYLRHLGTLDLFRMSGWIVVAVLAFFSVCHFSNTGDVADFALSLIFGLVAVVAGASVVINFQSALEFFDRADLDDGIKTDDHFAPADWRVEDEDSPQTPNFETK